MNLNLTHATRIGLNLSAMLGIAVLLKLGASLFIPLILSVLMASILYPGARFLNTRWGMPWFFACVMVLLAAVALFILVFVAFAIAIPRTIESLPRNEEAWKLQYKQIQRNLAQIIPYKLDAALPPNPDDSDMYQLIKGQFSDNNKSTGLQNIGLVFLAAFWQSILILFITLFLLLEGQMLGDKVRAIFGPSAGTQKRVSVAIAEMAKAIRTYLVWRTIVNLGLAVLLGGVYNLFGLQYWYLWALLVAMFSYVPYIGTIAAGIPPVLDALLFVGPGPALFIGVFYIGVVTVEGYIIVPWVMGRSMDLNATTVLLSCLFWELLWGISGLFLAMPLMAAIKAICTQVDGWEGWGELMSSGPAKPLLLETDAEKARIEAIARAAGADSEGTLQMDPSPEPPKKPRLDSDVP